MALVVGLGLMATATPAAHAGGNCQAPPGTSAIDQYCETIPAPGGDRSTKNLGGKVLAQSLSAGAVGALQNAGAEGRQVLRLPAGAPARRSAQGSAKRTAQGSAQRSGQARSADASPAPPAISNSPLSAVRSAVDSGTSAGAGFAWILLGVALVMLALAWIRYRRASGD